MRALLIGLISSSSSWAFRRHRWRGAERRNLEEKPAFKACEIRHRSTVYTVTCQFKPYFKLSFSAEKSIAGNVLLEEVLLYDTFRLAQEHSGREGNLLTSHFWFYFHWLDWAVTVGTRLGLKEVCVRHRSISVMKNVLWRTNQGLLIHAVLHVCLICTSPWLLPLDVGWDYRWVPGRG